MGVCLHSHVTGNSVQNTVYVRCFILDTTRDRQTEEEHEERRARGSLPSEHSALLAPHSSSGFRSRADRPPSPNRPSHLPEIGGLEV